ncbi:hypothetical protein Pelo_9311 [Pelomyxa schiedti]|nr:hypothetical protein Pelo_9311 [Pelomyxa schiedti]
MGNAEQRAMARKELENDVASINCMGPEYFLSRVKVLFDKYDENHNGKLEWKEAKRFLRDVGEICHNVIRIKMGSYLSQSLSSSLSRLVSRPHHQEVER